MFTQNEQQILDNLSKLDYGEDYIAALMGNIAVETGSFDYTQKQDNGSGYGTSIYRFSCCQTFK